MTDDRQQCDAYSENLAELALGILTGRARAATLAHVDSCAHCAEELEQLSRAADAVVSVAPELEPTVGFEVRLFNRMGLGDDPVPVPTLLDQGRRGTFRRVAAAPRWALASAAAVVALVVGLSIGWSIGSPSGNAAPRRSGAGGQRHPEGTRQCRRDRGHLRRFDAVDGRDPGRLFRQRDDHLRGGHRQRRDPRSAPSRPATATPPGTPPSRWRPRTCARPKWCRRTGR